MRFAILLFSLLMFAAPAFAAESDAQKAARYTAALEKDPLAADAKEMRTWTFQWLVETKDYHVTLCLNFFGKKKVDEVPYGGELVVQQMFGNVAYQINNPGKHDEVSKQMAGMESMLKAYSVIVTKDAKARTPYFDDLLAEQNNGTLKKRMATMIQNDCKSAKKS